MIEVSNKGLKLQKETSNNKNISGKLLKRKKKKKRLEQSIMNPKGNRFLLNIEINNNAVILHFFYFKILNRQFSDDYFYIFLYFIF